MKFNPFTGQLDLIGSGANASPWTNFNDTILSSTTKIIDSIVLAEFCSLEYFITFKNKVSGKKKTMQIRVVNNDGVVEDIIYGRFGAPLDLEVSADQSGLNYNLTIKNNIAADVRISASKLTLT